jgi:hypothetical protein
MADGKPRAEWSWWELPVLNREARRPKAPGGIATRGSPYEGQAGRRCGVRGALSGRPTVGARGGSPNVCRPGTSYNGSETSSTHLNCQFGGVTAISASAKWIEV